MRDMQLCLPSPLVDEQHDVVVVEERAVREQHHGQVRAAHAQQQQQLDDAEQQLVHGTADHHAQHAEREVLKQEEQNK